MGATGADAGTRGLHPPPTPPCEGGEKETQQAATRCAGVCYAAGMRRVSLTIVVFAELLLAPAAIGQSCGTKTYCREMTSCADALYHLKECGLTRLDGDGDGSPCESLCGDGGNRKNRKSARKTSVAEPPTADGETDFTCSGKRTCRQMSNCAEAIFYLQNCGVKQLDGNNDGVPCNALCR